MNLYPGDSIEVGVTRTPAPAAAPPPHERILRIVAATVADAVEGDGADLEDLVRRLEAEGFTLPPASFRTLPRR
jgi:hypothetical protein